MERLDRMVVQLLEARRLAEFEDVSHGRLALLLFDNAAETLLRQRAKDALVEASWYGNLLASMADIPDDPRDEDLRRLRSELEEKSVSEKTRQRIDKNFTDLVKYVTSLPDCEMEPELADCLNALHRYRNVAYHQNVVHADVLSPANEIYFYLCCRLLKEQRFLATPLGDVPLSVANLAPGLQISGWSTEKTVGDAVAEFLLSQRDLDHGSIRSALSDHLIARVGAVSRDLDEFIGFIGFKDKSSALRSIQLSPLTDESPLTPDEFWSRPLAVTENVMQGWGRRAAEIANLKSAPEALRKFDEIEKAVARFEDQLEPFMIAMDRQIQAEIDEMRGK